MNDNSGETPNPLNPSPTGATGTTPAAPSSVPEAAPVVSTGEPEATPVAPTEEPEAAASTPVTTQTPTDAASTTATVDSMDPTGRPMEKTVEAPQPVKKPKTGLIAGIIAGCVLLVGAIVAAVVLLGMNKGDAVAAAMQKIMSGEAPNKVAIDGDINIVSNKDTSLVKRLNINLDSDIMVGSMINTSSAVLTFTDKNDKDYSMSFEEIYAANGDLFFKLTDAKKVIEELGALSLMNGTTPTTNCIEDESGATNCETPIVTTDCTAEGESEDCVTAETTTDTTGVSALADNALISVIDAIDGVYIRLSSDEMSLLKNQTAGNSDISCVTDLVSNLDKNTNSAIQLYNKYPFIQSSNEKIPVAMKQNPIYRIWLDDENFTNYVNEMQNTEIANSLFSCLKWNNKVTISKEDVTNITSKMPDIYAEVNANNEFTRLYLESDINDGEATATIDLGFSYPNNVNVSEPVEYKDFSEFIQTIMKSMYNL